MKNASLWVIIFFCLLAFAFCKQEDTNKTHIVFGEKATLGWQECVNFTKYSLKVCFIDANEDRCPCYADCTAEGTVEFILDIKGVGIDTTVTLETNSNPVNLKDSILIGNQMLRISRPFPVDCNKYGYYEKYKVNVSVKE